MDIVENPSTNRDNFNYISDDMEDSVDCMDFVSKDMHPNMFT